MTFPTIVMDFSCHDEAKLEEETLVDISSFLDSPLLSPRSNSMAKGSRLSGQSQENDTETVVSTGVLELRRVGPPTQPNFSQEQVPNSAGPDPSMISIPRQQISSNRDSRKTAIPSSAVVTIKSPDWKPTRRRRFDSDDGCAIDNRTRTPGTRMARYLDQTIADAPRLQTSALSENHLAPENGDDEASNETNTLEYIPYHRFGVSVAQTNQSSAITRNRTFQQAGNQPLLYSNRNPANRYGKQQTHRLQQGSIQTSLHRMGSQCSVASSPSNNRQSLASMPGSLYTSYSGRSRLSTFSCRSSTNASLQHDEVINLEDEGTLAAAVEASKLRRHYRPHLQQRNLLHGVPETEGVINCHSKHQEPPLWLDLDLRRETDDLDISLEGMEIGMSPQEKSNPCTSYHRDSKQPPNEGPFLSWGIAAEYVSACRRKARNCVDNMTDIAKSIKEQATSKTEFILHHYRPPLSPRSRELRNLQFLQESHKEKVEKWKFETSNKTKRIEKDDSFLDDQNFCDFVLILTPQEVYRYWADLLDFREEHLGMVASGNLWERNIESLLESTSIDTNSKTTEEAKSSTESTLHHDNEEMDLHTDLPADLVTPLTGLLRRRAKSTPESKSSKPNLSSANKNTICSFKTNLYSQQSQSFLSSPESTSKRGTRMSLFERAINSPLLSHSSRQRTVSQDYSMSTYTISEAGGELETTTPGNGIYTVRRRWGNHTMPLTTSNMLSPPVRSLTRGAGSVSKLMIGAATVNRRKAGDGPVICNDSRSCGPSKSLKNPNYIDSEYEIPNPVIPRGILVRTNGMLQFLSALRRGIIVRRHRPNKEAIFCKIFSLDGGDTIQYQLVDAEEALVAFKEQRVRYNRILSHSSSPSKIRTVSSEWSCLDGPVDGGPIHKFKVPDHIAAQRYREKLQREHGFTKHLFEIATKAANSGIIRAADLVSVHPAYHLDPRHPGVRKGEFGTASLRRSLSEYFPRHTFSLITTVRQNLKKGKNGECKYSKEAEDKWYKGEGSELQFKILDFEAATEGEFWLVLRGFLHLHRDAAANRFAAKRSAGIGGGFRATTDSRNEDGGIDTIENVLQQDSFIEPKTAGWLEKTIIKIRKLDDTYLTGAVTPSSIPPPSDYFLGFKSPGTQIWSRLRLAGLETQRIYAINTRRVLIKIRCPADRLTDVAEVLRVKMETLDGSFAPFREDTAHVFRQREDTLDIPPLYHGQMASLLRSKDRQNVIDFIIGSRIRDSGAELGQRSDVGKMIEARIPLHMPRKLESLCKDWVYYWRRERWTGVINNDHESSAVPESEEVSLGNKFSVSKNKRNRNEQIVPRFFVRFFVEAFNQPLDAIEDYFGEKVTFYFAWLQHCARHLLVLSFFGLIMSFCQVSTDNFDHPLRPLYAMGVMLWTFIVLINWRKRSNYLAYRWGSMDHTVQETTRPEFHGEYVVDPITSEWEIKYPKWRRWLKYLISVPITVAFTGLAVLLILLVHTNRDRQMAKYVELKTNPEADPVSFQLKLENIGYNEIVGDVELSKELLLDPTYWFIMAFLPSLLGLCIPILNLVLMKISIILNDFENYRFESEYRTHLIIKVFSFRFVSQFGTVYYYAFVSTGTRAAIENGIIRMGTSVMVYTTVAHWWNIFLQVYFSMIIRYLRRKSYQRNLREELKHIELLEEDHVTKEQSDAEAREIRLMNKRILLDQAQDDLWLEVMNPPHDSFQEYVQAVVQFSFVACFSVVLPITPLLVLINYLLSMRFDAYKLCRGRRRPLAMRTGGIGVWEHLLHIVAVIAVLTNCWLIAFTNVGFDWLWKHMGPTATVFIVVAWEHVMLLIKYMMSTTISPFPKEIRDEMKRKQHDLEQERYAMMRSKKERSRRSKFRKSLSEDFRKVHEASTLNKEQTTAKGSRIDSLVSSRTMEEVLSDVITSESPGLSSRLSAIGSSDKTFAGQPKELYEC